MLLFNYLYIWIFILIHIIHIFKIKVGRPSGAGNTVSSIPVVSSTVGSGIELVPTPQGFGLPVSSLPVTSVKLQAQVSYNKNK